MHDEFEKDEFMLDGGEIDEEDLADDLDEEEGEETEDEEEL